MKDTILTDQRRQTCKEEEGKTEGKTESTEGTQKRDTISKHKTQDTTQRHQIKNHDTDRLQKH